MIGAEMKRTYPRIVELGLDAHHVALLLVLRPQHRQLSWVERPVALRQHLAHIQVPAVSTHVSASIASGGADWLAVFYGNPGGLLAGKAHTWKLCHCGKPWRVSGLSDIASGGIQDMRTASGPDRFEHGDTVEV